jgi:hypothetical protein
LDPLVDLLREGEREKPGPPGRHRRLGNTLIAVKAFLLFYPETLLLMAFVLCAARPFFCSTVGSKTWAITSNISSRWDSGTKIRAFAGCPVWGPF